jgi:hypothetical protein
VNHASPALACTGEPVGFQYGTNRAEVEGFQQEFTSRYNLPGMMAQIEPVLGNQVGPDILGVIISEKKPQ